MSYTKLFTDILASTIWAEDNATRIVWITMLAMADRDGIVQSSLPGLAHMSRVTLQEAEQALMILSAPDTHFRTKDNDGRRIAEAPGGWHILNYEAHRDRASRDEAREKAAARQRRKRERDRHGGVTSRPRVTDAKSHDGNAKSLHASPSPSAEAVKEGRKERVGDIHLGTCRDINGQPITDDRIREMDFALRDLGVFDIAPEKRHELAVGLVGDAWDVEGLLLVAETVQGQGKARAARLHGILSNPDTAAGAWDEACRKAAGK